MIHMRLVATDAFAGHRASNESICIAMRHVERVSRFVQIEPHDPPKRLTDFLFTTWRTLRDAVWIRKIRPGSVDTNNAEALSSMLK
jgi:hypothetical protein